MNKLVNLLPLLGLAACTVGPSLQTRMASFTGASAQTLVQNFGVPDKQITINDTQYLAYDKHRLDYDPGIYGSGGFGWYNGFGPFYAGGYFEGPLIGPGVPPSLTEQECETTFVLRQGKVVSFSLRGNDCS